MTSARRSYIHVDKAVYEKILAMSRAGAPAVTISKELNLARGTVAKAMNTGWPLRGFPSIKDVLAGDKQAARAAERVASEQDAVRSLEERDLARKQAVDTMLAELRMMGIARNGVTGVLAIAAELVPAMVIVGRGLSDLIKRKMADGEIDIDEGLRILGRMSYMIRQGVGAASDLISSERERQTTPDGAPQADTVEDMTDEQALAQLEQVREMLDVTHARGFIVIEGGKSRVGDGEGTPVQPIQPGTPPSVA